MTPALGYSEMKDSGIPWVGNVPSDWEVFPAGGVFKEVKEKNTDNKFTNPFSFRYGEIVDKKIIGGIDESVEETLSAYRVVSPNTIMLNGLNLNYDFISQRVAIVKEQGIITSAYLAVKPDEKRVYPYFVLYLLKAYDYRQVLHSIGSGIRKTLKYQDFKSIKIVAPTMDKQKEIVSYLDAQSVKIDEIIAEAKASIEDYKKWKSSIIYEAVTKGLDPDVEMKESGFSWLGMVPSNWNVTRMKSVFQNISIKNHPKEEVLSLYRDLGVVPKNSRDDNHNITSEDTAQYKFVEKGDLVINKMKAWQGSLAVSDYSGIVSPAYYVCRFRSKNMDKRYIHYLLRCSAYAQEFERLSTGMRIGQWDLGIDDFLRIPVLLPDASEQVAIAAYLDDLCAKIDELITEKQTLISDLEAYKKSLIYEVVTGKRQVC